MTIRYSRSERQQHLDTWHQSGLSKTHYCRLHDLNIATFYYWLKHQQDDATVTVPSAFIPAQRVVPENNHAATVTLNLPNGCSVTFIWTGQKWSYLAVVMDLFARKSEGGACSTRTREASIQACT